MIAHKFIRLTAGVLACVFAVGWASVGAAYAQEAGGSTLNAEGPDIAAESAVLMEASTGEVLYEKNPHKALPESLAGTTWFRLASTPPPWAEAKCFWSPARSRRPPTLQSALL